MHMMINGYEFNFNIGNKPGENSGILHTNSAALSYFQAREELVQSACCCADTCEFRDKKSGCIYFYQVWVLYSTVISDKLSEI